MDSTQTTDEFEMTETDRGLCEIGDTLRARAFDQPACTVAESFIPKMADRIRELSRQLHAAEADAARLAEALGDCADDLESGVNAANPPAWGDVYPIMARRRQRDLEPVKKAREALASHTARLIDG